MLRLMVLNPVDANEFIRSGVDLDQVATQLGFDGWTSTVVSELPSKLDEEFLERIWKVQEVVGRDRRESRWPRMRLLDSPVLVMALQ